MTRELALALVAVVVGCGGGSQPGAHAAHDQHEHGHHEHGPLVHRFDDAEKWARVFDDPARDAWQKPADVIAAMQIAPGMVVVDLGAGTGYFEPWLSRAVGDTGVVWALDIEPNMVRYLDDRARREHLTNVRTAVVTVEDAKIPDASADRILAVDVWHHIPARDGYAARMRQALKPGGKLFVVDFKLEAQHGPPRHHRITAEQVSKELSAAGLVAEIVPVPSLEEQYVVAGTRR